MMSRTAIPLQTSDVSSLARALRSQLIGRDTVPGHVELLNMLARSVGCRNFQQLRAQAATPIAPLAPAQLGPTIDWRAVERTRRCFDNNGRLTRWPAKRGDQVLALWGLWSQLPPRQITTEQEISQVLRGLHDFGDHALLRRELTEARLVSRTPDCREYVRIERPPPADAAMLIAQLKVDQPSR
jgi:hypothetical protein